MYLIRIVHMKCKEFLRFNPDNVIVMHAVSGCKQYNDKKSIIMAKIVIFNS